MVRHVAPLRRGQMATRQTPLAFRRSSPRRPKSLLRIEDYVGEVTAADGMFLISCVC